ncbi:hypothetical protein [Lacinutrix himadriensis]|uniref:hypothetical protein n=1 Tax=Lacinutrix himadriensis TaxID=641549 RepID=UPI0006E1A709|nr:hypothetical protein [Lacinutrix himadriensis]
MKITLIGLDKWKFNQFICDELMKQNHEVHHINFDAFLYKYPSFFHKGINFFLKTFFNYNMKRVHLNKHILKNLEAIGKQDKILIIKGDNLSKKTLKHIKKNYTNELIAFFNDSFSRYPRMKKVQNVFDTVFSFERKDVEQFDFHFVSNYIYFPIEKFHADKAFEYDIFNISSLDKRENTLPIIANYFKSLSIRYKLIAYTRDKSITKIEGVDYIDKKIELQEMEKMVDKSKTMLDIQRPKQEGLSFRVFEALGKHKKLITTNASLASYDFYDPNNIAIIDVDNMHVSPDFFKTPYKEVDAEIINKYHISNWVNTVFNLN